MKDDKKKVNPAELLGAPEEKKVEKKAEKKEEKTEEKKDTPLKKAAKKIAKKVENAQDEKAADAKIDYKAQAVAAEERVTKMVAKDKKDMKSTAAMWAGNGAPPPLSAGDIATIAAEKGDFDPSLNPLHKEGTMLESTHYAVKEEKKADTKVEAKAEAKTEKKSETKAAAF